MVQIYVLDPMAGDLCPKHLCVSDNRTLIDLLISYALCVVPSYAWNYLGTVLLFRYNKLVWLPVVSDII